ncbi:glycosyltransferase [Haliangium sp.]|uniref:glycosyltransferase n=1 Tax=Haliangium sp. TaxID=2663208 RepID=UPI003D10DA3C
MAQIVVVIPCYNEAARLAPEKFSLLLDHDDVGLLFVDDGSTDRTLEVLETMRADLGAGTDILALPENRGKAEAVRAGLAHALAGGAEIVGYLDADMATPPDEALRLIDALVAGGVDAVIGARIAFMGTDIHRSPVRHYLGRVFATFASVILAERIYDTQCGAKFFRAGPALTRAIDEPFPSRWAFDVELLGRFLAAGGTLMEVPLRRWIDIEGSKMNPGSMIRGGLDLVSIAVRLRRRKSGG